MALAYKPEQTVLPFRLAPDPRGPDKTNWSDLDLLNALVGVEAARLLLARFRSLPAVIGGDEAEVERIAGRNVLNALEVVRESATRMTRADAYKRPSLTSWSELKAYLNVMMAWVGREQFRVLFLDKKNRLITDEAMWRGTIDHAPVYPREVVRRALEVDASAVILAHNHPTGDPTPSAADIDMTAQVIDACRALKIAVHDHIVVGREGHASLKALGLLTR